MLHLKKVIFTFAFGIACLNVYAQNENTDIQMTQEKYVRPEMADYPKSYEEVTATLAPYYQAKRPLDYFFELYVIDTLEKLPSDSKEALLVFLKKTPVEPRYTQPTKQSVRKTLKSILFWRMTCQQRRLKKKQLKQYPLASGSD